MAPRIERFHLVVALSLVFVLVGSGVGVWNYQDVRACHELYDDDPTIVAECEDSLTTAVRGLSILSVVVGSGGLALVLYRRSS